MANSSDAFGTVTITAPNPTLLAQFLYLQDAANENVEYYTHFPSIVNSPLEEIQEYVNQHAEQEEGQTTISLDFIATGRWSFLSNIEWFYDILKEDSWSDPELHNLAETLQPHPFQANFTVTDSESGCDFIVKYTQKTKWDHKTGQAVEEPEFYYTSTSYNASSLIHQGLYDDGEVWDLGYVRDYFDYFVDCLKNNYSENDDFLRIRQNILDNLDGFETFINTSDFEYDYVCHDLREFLFDMLQLTPETKF